MVGPLLLSLLRSSARTSFSSSATKPPYHSFSSHVSHILARATSVARAFSVAPASMSPSLDTSRLRNVAVKAHVDHEKTTLMDRLLRQCGADIPHERAMDFTSLERERGITIACKVERVVGMVEGATLVVDAVEGLLAQTKFVLARALKYGLCPILLLNKVDRPAEEQLEFPVLYASVKEGWASSTFTKNPPADARNMSQLLDAIVRHVPLPEASLNAPFQMINILGMLRSMYALICLEEDAAFLLNGLISTDNAADVRKEVAKPCTEIRPHALALVSSFGIPDAFLSPMAYDWMQANSWSSVKQ